MSNKSLEGLWSIEAAPCARLQLVRGPVRNIGRVQPFNGIVSQHERRPGNRHK